LQEKITEMLGLLQIFQVFTIKGQMSVLLDAFIKGQMVNSQGHRMQLKVKCPRHCSKTIIGQMSRSFQGQMLR